MGDIILARHAENEYSVRRIANGDPTVPVHLTAAGRQQAIALGEDLVGTAIDQCVTSCFIRTVETADDALRGVAVPRTVDGRLDDIGYGRFEGQSLDLYHAWATEHDMAEIVPGGSESRMDVVARCLGAVSRLLERPENTVLVVTHEMIISYLLNGVRHENPAPMAKEIAYATPYRFSFREMESACEALQRWLDGRRRSEGWR